MTDQEQTGARHHRPDTYDTVAFLLGVSCGIIIGGGVAVMGML